MPVRQSDLEAFKKLSPADRHQYLLDTDPDYRSLSRFDQQAYVADVTGEKPSVDQSVVAKAKERSAQPTEFERSTADRSKLSLEGVGSTLGREAKSAVGAVTGIPSAIYHAAVDKPTPEESKMYPGSVGRAVIPLDRMLAQPFRTAGKWYGEVAKGQIPDPVGQALSVAPEAVGNAAGTVVAGKAVPAVAGAVTTAIRKHFATFPRTTAANMIADAVIPDAKARPQYVQNLVDHWDKITSYAKDRGIPLNSVKNLVQASQGASDALNNHFSNLVEPHASVAPFAENPSYTIGDMHNRLMTINNKLLPAYERGAGAVDPLQAVKAQQDLNSEAGWLRKNLYGLLSDATGIAPEDLQAVNEGGGALRNIAQKTQLGLSKTQNTAALAGREPVSISPFGGKKFLGDKAANYVLKKAGMTTDPDSLVTRAFRNTPNYDYNLPQATKSPAPNLSSPLGQIPAKTPEAALALSSTPVAKGVVPQESIDQANRYVDLAHSDIPNAASMTVGAPISGAGSGAPIPDDLAIVGTPGVPMPIRAALQAGQYAQPPSSYAAGKLYPRAAQAAWSSLPPEQQ